MLAALAVVVVVGLVSLIPITRAYLLVLLQVWGILL